MQTVQSNTELNCFFVASVLHYNYKIPFFAKRYNFCNCNKIYKRHTKITSYVGQAILTKNFKTFLPLPGEFFGDPGGGGGGGEVSLVGGARKVAAVPYGNSSDGKTVVGVAKEAWPPIGYDFSSCFTISESSMTLYGNKTATLHVHAIFRNHTQRLPYKAQTKFSLCQCIF